MAKRLKPIICLFNAGRTSSLLLGSFHHSLKLGTSSPSGSNKGGLFKIPQSIASEFSHLWSKYTKHLANIKTPSFHWYNFRIKYLYVPKIQTMALMWLNIMPNRFTQAKSNYSTQKENYVWSDKNWIDETDRSDHSVTWVSCLQWLKNIEISLSFIWRHVPTREA